MAFWIFPRRPSGHRSFDRHPRSARQLRGVVLVCAVLGAACGPARFPKELYTLHGEGADYPVMVSRAPNDAAGRPVHAESGTKFAQQSHSYSTYSATVTVTTTQSSRSEMPAMSKVMAQVKRNDRFLQVDGLTFYAEDFSAMSSSSSDRLFSISGQVK